MHIQDCMSVYLHVHIHVCVYMCTVGKHISDIVVCLAAEGII